MRISKDMRRYRRAMKRQKERRLRKIIVQKHLYYPYRSVFTRDRSIGAIKDIGRCIRYTKNSHPELYLKKMGNRTVRRYQKRHLWLPAKGNHYRKVFNYWEYLT